MSAREKLIRDACDRIDIVPRVGLLALYDLASSVRRSKCAERPRVKHSHDPRDLLTVLDGTRDAEVEHLDHVVVGEERIGRFEVGVHDTLLMRISHRTADSLREAQGLLHTQTDSFITLDEPIERLPFEELHNHVDIRAVAIEVVDGDDVGMRELLRLARFALQSLQRLRMPAELLVEDLDGDVRVAILGLHFTQVACFEDRAHTAGADGFLQDEPVVNDASHAGYGARIGPESRIAPARPGGGTGIRRGRGRR